MTRRFCLAVFQFICVLSSSTILSGCSTTWPIEPWVKPYEREHLADPIMQFSHDALSDKHFEHVHIVREAARGATGAEGGGCGCN